mmetsp:Transcript_19306/g.43995  ORF Transcript_19306/g.43995 Transcript_19306/m.43995 type:complete len:308 (-) Transcript_19306:486-1409(-)
MATPGGKAARNHDLDTILDAALDEIDSGSSSGSDSDSSDQSDGYNHVDGDGDGDDDCDGDGDGDGGISIPADASSSVVPNRSKLKLEEHTVGGDVQSNFGASFDDTTTLSAMKELFSEMNLEGEMGDIEKVINEINTSSEKNSTGHCDDVEVDQAVERLLNGLKEAASTENITDNESSSSDQGSKNADKKDPAKSQIPGMDQFGEIGEELMETFLHEFEKMGEKDDFDTVVDGMMKQLIARDLMYEPMKQVTDKFPAWLAEARNSLSEEEYQRYGQQYQYFQRIVQVYETDPDNFPRLMELMHKIQE